MAADTTMAAPDQAELIPDPGFWEGATAYWMAVLEVLDSKELPQLMQDAAD